jgi:hypothetical protein
MTSPCLPPSPFGLLPSYAPAGGAARTAGTGACTAALPLTSRSPAGFRGVFCGVPDCPFQALITSDDQSASLFGYTGQVTLSGYDNMTGLGTPNGAGFISALRKLES